MNGPGGRSCTCTGSGLSGVPLLLGYAGEGDGTPGRTFACNLRVRSAVLYTLSYGSMKIGSPGWIRTIDLLVQSQALLLLSYGATCSAWRKLEDMLPIPQSGTFRFRGGPGALVRFNFLMHEDGGSQGSRSPIRLRDGSIRFPTGGGSQPLWLPQMAAPGGFAPPTFRFRAGCSTS